MFFGPCFDYQNPNQGGYGPSVLCDLNFHLVIRETLVMCVVFFTQFLIHVVALDWFYSVVLKPIGPNSSLGFITFICFHSMTFHLVISSSYSIPCLFLSDQFYSSQLYAINIAYRWVHMALIKSWHYPL